jgi:hypothetical protein
MGRRKSFSDKFWHDKHGNFVVWQRPNVLLIIWLAAIVLTVILPDSVVQRGIGEIAEIVIVLWAILELFRGSSYFRRLLGFCVLLLIVTARLI